MPTMSVAGELNSITDIAGIRVGHATRTGNGALTGTTVILLPPGSSAAVDVRGGAPATRDTAALDPVYGAGNADVFVLTGGSAYGLTTAHGVLTWLSEHDSRFEQPHAVPAAAVFDLGRGGDFHAHPGPEVGAEAARTAATSGEHAPLAQGNVGAGTGAVNAETKGGVGTASVVLPGDIVVAALAVNNAHHPSVDPATGLPYAIGLGTSGRRTGTGVTDWDEFGLSRPSSGSVSSAGQRLAETAKTRPTINPMNTVIGVVATNARLTPGQARQLAGAAQDGIALAIRPSHGIFDGDTIFAAATGEKSGPDLPVDDILSAAAPVFARALVHAILAATSVDTGWGHIAAYRELFADLSSG